MDTCPFKTLVESVMSQFFKTEGNKTQTLAALRKMPAKTNYFKEFSTLAARHIWKFKGKGECCTRCKCTNASQYWLRKAGDQSKEDLRRLEALNAAVAYSRPDTRQIAKVYMARSELFLSKGYYKECMEDTSRYEQSFSKARLTRPRKYLRIRTRHVLEDEQEVYHHEIPQVTELQYKLVEAGDGEKRQNPSKKGFRMLANRDLKAGDVIFTEEAFAISYHVYARFTHCHHCLELCYNLICCDGCSEELYCSDKCKVAAFESYHKFECGLFQMGLAWERLYLRLVLKLITDLRKQDPEHREGLKKYGFFIDKDIEDYFLDADVRIIFRSCIEPLLFWHSLNRLSAVMSYVPGDTKTDKEKILVELLFYQKLAVDIYQIDIYEENSCKKIKIGDGIFKLHSKIRDCCRPNTFPVFYGNVLVLRAKTDIKQDEEILVDYRSFKSSMPKMDTPENPFACRCHLCYGKPSTENSQDDIDALSALVANWKSTTDHTVDDIDAFLKAGTKLLAEYDKQLVECEYVPHGNTKLDF